MSALFTSSSFIQVLIQQLLEYVTEHADEIIAMILKLLSKDKKPSESVKKAAKSFKIDPTEKTFSALLKQVKKEDPLVIHKLSGQILSKAKVKATK